MGQRSAVKKLVREFVKANCRFCAGNTITSDGEYLKRRDKENRHWAVDGVDYWSCGLSDADRKLLSEATR